MQRLLTRWALAGAICLSVLCGRDGYAAADGQRPAAVPQRLIEPVGADALGSNVNRIDERRRMVERQITNPSDRRIPVGQPEVVAGMLAVPRHVMVPPAMQRRAYDDTPLPIGHGQTISQPYIVAIMTELLELGPQDRVLEVGTGSGYQAAVLAHITPHVYSIEIIAPLLDQARTVLAQHGYGNIRLKHGDGYFGWEAQAPFDAIIVTCAAGHLPPPLWRQLKPGGRIVIPIGGPYEVQRLVVLSKHADGSRSSRSVMPVRFVPMTRSE